MLAAFYKRAHTWLVGPNARFYGTSRDLLKIFDRSSDLARPVHYRLSLMFDPVGPGLGGLARKQSRAKDMSES